MLQTRPRRHTPRLSSISCHPVQGIQRCSRCAAGTSIGVATAAAIGYAHLLRGVAALLGAVRLAARRARVVLRAAILPARRVRGWTASLGCTGVHGLAAIDADAVIAARASVGGVPRRRS